MYHGIHRSPRDPGFHPRYSVGVERFTRQLDWLVAQGFRTVRLDDQLGAPRPVVLTFDDGDASAVEVALPLLAERGMVAEFCVPSAHVGRPGYVSERDVRVLADGGMGIQSHGRTHRQLSTLSDDELDDELSVSRQDLARWSGRPVIALSAPGGRAGRRELRAARAAGYRFVLNSVPGPNRRIRPDRYLHRNVVVSSTTLDDFAGLVRWQGASPRRLVVRTFALEVPKRLLGERRYGRLREAVSSR